MCPVFISITFCDGPFAQKYFHICERFLVIWPYRAFTAPACLAEPYAEVFRKRGGCSNMYGTFGGYTRWAVVFLIIFVLFFLLVPGYGAGAGAGY